MPQATPDAVESAEGTQLLPRSDNRILVRGWNHGAELAGGHASLAGRLLAAARGGCTPGELAALTGVPFVRVQALVERLLEQGLLEPSPLRRGPAAPLPAARALGAATEPGSVLDAVVTDDPALAEHLTAELRHRPGTPDFVVTGNAAELARRADGRAVNAVLPRHLVERDDDPAVRGVLTTGGRWACYWREHGRTVVTSDLSCSGPGYGLCLACLRLRERAGARSPRRGGDDGHRTVYAPGNVYAPPTAALLAHVLAGLRAGPPAAAGGAVLYELHHDRVRLSRVRGLPVCPACTPLAGGPYGDLLLTSPPRSLSPPETPAVHAARPDGAVRPPAAAPEDALSLEQITDRCRRSSDLPAPELAALLRDLGELYGRRGTVLRAIRPEVPAVAADCFHAVAADLADLRRISASNGQPQAYDAFGGAWTAAGAVQRCLGEAVERYCALVHGAARRVVWGAADELPDAVPVERFATLSPAELRDSGRDLRPASSRSRLGWVEGHSLTRARPVLVPAQLSFLAYTAAASEDAVQPGSNKGLAAGRSADRCVVHGLCELVEADALLIHFLNRSPVPEIGLGDTGIPRVDRVHRAVRAAGGRLRAWDFATDLAVPTVLVMLERHDGTGPVATFGMATRPDPANALEKAVLEALHATCWLTGEMAEAARAFPGVPTPEWVTAREQAKSLGASSAYLASLGWLLDREVRRPFREYAAGYPEVAHDPAAQRHGLVGALAAAGLEPVAVDLSTPDVRDATGLEVWRSIVPGLQPFSIGTLQARAGDRLFSVPVRMGYRSAPAAESDLNPLPHPCP
ncbi:hypothetical protein DVA86_33165 [Streptomyces armeniacus]|uniref:YcaO domain-containing protein n=1 Tax=Streptomyces armeniacus TaxID=83291 RepID=A0A345XYH6_9ACTN|nr:YcaO-like family protein [Streptomyces armeniacus]AXK36692.1 hypothetical protein DVA86_33165 [Streptomyces armeniacus]